MIAIYANNTGFLPYTGKFIFPKKQEWRRCTLLFWLQTSIENTLFIEIEASMIPDLLRA